MDPIGDRIKEAADAIGGVPKLAQETGIPRRTLYGYIQGPAEPTSTQLSRIILATSVSPRWLVLGVGPKFEPSEDDGPLAKSLAKDATIAQSYAGVDIEVVGGRDADDADDADNSEVAIDPDVMVEIERAIREVYEQQGVSASPTALLRLAVTWYNGMMGAGVELADREEIKSRIYVKRKELERELQSRAPTQHTSQKGPPVS